MLVHSVIPTGAKNRSKGWRVRKVLEVMAYYSGLDSVRSVILFLCALCNIPSPYRCVGDVSTLPVDIPLKTQQGKTIMHMRLTPISEEEWDKQSGECPLAYYIPSRLDLNFGGGRGELKVITDIIKSYSKLAKSLGFRVEKAPPQLRRFLTFIAAFNAKVIAELGSFCEGGGNS